MSEFKRIEKNDVPERDRVINRMADAVHRMNEAVAKAVDAGITVELVRVSRHHCGNGNWGDQMVPMIREPAEQQKSA